MEFVHVSKKLETEKKLFIPGIPLYRCDGEDGVTKRICVCPTIKEAISAFPYKNELVNWTMRFKKNNYLAVYKTESENFLNHEEIHDRVPDSHITREHWILEPFTAEPQLIKIKKLSLSIYNKYINGYSGKVKDLEYETEVTDYDRDEEIVFISKRNFKKFSNIANQNNISFEILEDKHVQMPYYYYNIPTTKKYRWIKVMVHIPAGVSVAPLWLIDDEQNNFAWKRKFSIKEWKYNEFWWELEE